MIPDLRLTYISKPIGFFIHLIKSKNRTNLKHYYKFSSKALSNFLCLFIYEKLFLNL